MSAPVTQIDIVGDVRHDVKVYRRRWLILVLNVIIMWVVATPWMQYVVVSDVLTAYYHVSNEMLEWTSLVFYATAMIFTFPAAWLLNKYGLRSCFLLAVAVAALSQWVKLPGVWSDRYWLILLGQTMLSIAVAFVMPTPARLAAVWFPANELSLAVGSGFIGQMCGVSLGCALGPLSASPSWSPEQIFDGLMLQHVILTGVSTIVLIATFFLFTNAPRLPPSPAQAAAAAVAVNSSFFQSMKRVCKDIHFIYLVLAYNIITSVYIAVATLLNRTIVEFFPDRSAEVGWLATITTLSGVFGMILIAVVLDRTKLYKEVTVFVYVGALASLIAFTVAITMSSMTAIYALSALLGVFMTSFFVPGFEMCAEITYPEPEGNPTSILTWVLQPVGMLLTLAVSAIFTRWGALAGHVFMCALMVLGLSALLAIPKKYRRREAELALAASSLAEKPSNGALESIFNTPQ